jgi:hypothetical protein
LQVQQTPLLTEVGYLSVSPFRIGKSQQWSIALTDKGKEFLTKYDENRAYGQAGKAGCETSQYTFPLATFEFGAIDGITKESKDSNTAVVHFNWKWKPTTLGTAYLNASPQVRDSAHVVNSHLPFDLKTSFPRFEDQRFSSARFTLYDDGWRFEKIIE